tara:strand:+ start:12 stop:362 length:351 start_codon:yes stop_codon:yes gene_type:complete
MVCVLDLHPLAAGTEKMFSARKELSAKYWNLSDEFSKPAKAKDIPESTKDGLTDASGGIVGEKTPPFISRMYESGAAEDNGSGSTNRALLSTGKSGRSNIGNPSPIFLVPRLIPSG